MWPVCAQCEWTHTQLLLLFSLFWHNVRCGLGVKTHFHLHKTLGGSNTTSWLGWGHGGGWRWLACPSKLAIITMFKLQATSVTVWYLYFARAPWDRLLQGRFLIVVIVNRRFVLFLFKVSVQTPFRTRYRFKSTGLAQRHFSKRETIFCHLLPIGVTLTFSRDPAARSTPKVKPGTLHFI